MIHEICNKLREKRKELGYSLEHTVEKTKLHPSMIRDIESGNLSNINPIYLKGFLKIYAAFLGVDATKALEEISTQPQLSKKHRKIKSRDEGRLSVGKRFFKTLKNIPPEVKRYALVGLAVLVLKSCSSSRVISSLAYASNGDLDTRFHSFCFCCSANCCWR